MIQSDRPAEEKDHYQQACTHENKHCRLYKTHQSFCVGIRSRAALGNVSVYIVLHCSRSESTLEDSDLIVFEVNVCCLVLLILTRNK